MSLDPRCYLLGAVMLLTIPLPWLAASITAAAVHEVFHLGMIRLCRGQVQELRIGPLGAVIQTGPLTDHQELLCALAGPAGSLLLFLFLHCFPRLALCGTVQGLFNLLPFYPLDGGRAIRACLRLTFPGNADALADTIESLLLVLLLIFTMIYLRRLACILCLCFLWKRILRKKPCKHGPFGVQ